jgi:hypothetical protein
METADVRQTECRVSAFMGRLSGVFVTWEILFGFMKTSWLTIGLLVLAVGGTRGQVSQPDASYQITERGANRRVWQKTVCTTTPSGQTVAQDHSVTELATGLNYWDSNTGQWVESREQIDILPDGTAAATQGQHQAYFPGDIYECVVELVTPDGIRLQSRPIGLSYDDGTNTVLIAELKPSAGELIGANQIVYPDAFTDFRANLRYTYTKAGFEQDIVLLEQPPSPETCGLNPQTARLQVLTEFLSTSEPVQAARMIDPQNGVQDTTLTFGQMKMTRGTAFSIAGTVQAKGVAVSKSWQHLERRTFLVEELPVQTIDAQLRQLPVRESGEAAKNSPDTVRHKVSVTHLLPPTRLVRAGTHAVQLAKANLQPKQGVVLDYTIVTGSQSNFTFHSGSTYFVSGWLYLSGVTTFEEDAVIKQLNARLTIDENGSMDCQTSPEHPAIFTSANDDSVGETITNSTGLPSDWDADTSCKFT